MPYPVQNLIEGRSEPVSVHPEESAQRALELITSTTSANFQSLMIQNAQWAWSRMNLFSEV